MRYRGELFLAHVRQKDLTLTRAGPDTFNLTIGRVTLGIWSDAYLGADVEPAELALEFPQPTPRQVQLAEHFLAGYYLGEAAEAIGLKYETARSHLRAAYRRFDVHSQMQFVARLLDAGCIDMHRVMQLQARRQARRAGVIFTSFDS